MVRAKKNTTILEKRGMGSTGQGFERLVEIMAKLRDPSGGCPWDLEQDHQSLTPYLIEEAYEVIEAIQVEDDNELATELGDLLLQVVFHAQMAKQRNVFDIEEVIKRISEKLIRRHPHVFDKTKVSGSDEVLRNWEKIKQQERVDAKAANKSTLAGVPRSMPSLIRSQRLGEKASKVSFDWEAVEGVWNKVKEEFEELQAEIDEHKSANNQNSDSENKDRIVHEMGDLLFSICQLARWTGVSAEESLHQACQRFTQRFERMESSASGDLRSKSFEELDQLWNKSKEA
jgi:MazG family protein